MRLPTITYMHILLHRFGDTANYWPKIAIFLDPSLLTYWFEVNPFEFLDEPYLAKNVLKVWCDYGPLKRLETCRSRTID